MPQLLEPTKIVNYRAVTTDVCEALIGSVVKGDTQARIPNEADFLPQVQKNQIGTWEDLIGYSTLL